ncbi:hypothetical protein [uncultured Paraglaciecola sp.]|uniref:hypothetical protein n=1 Tax=uncultured Paraglaciecola sp. TaxID=1765024 RepID=UPI0026310CC2|nr:hypothetical protein [uncultured Paraglaciecola sp.]
MNDFENIPNKSLVQLNTASSDLWPELGEAFVLNQFYRSYSRAEGWLGNGYIAIWTQDEVQNFQEANLGAYPDKYHFFASDGGGTQFGFFIKNDTVSFVSAPDIGDEEDVRVLGNWEQFLKLVTAGDYI